MRDIRVWAAIALILNLAAIAANVWVSRKARALRMFATGARFPLPGGRTLDGTYVPVPTRGSRPCYLVRFGSEECPQSKADVAALESLERRLNERQCVSLFMAPTPGLFQRPVDRRRINLAFLDLASAAQIPFVGTPTTIVVDGEGIIHWSKIGPLENRDVTEALRSIR